MAISLRTGILIAPALHDTDRIPLTELMAAPKDLAAPGTRRTTARPGER